MKKPSLPIPLVDLNAQYQTIRVPLNEAVLRVFETSDYILGNAVQNFENRFSKYVGVKHCIALNSGTSALHLAMLILGIGVGDEVILPAHTYIASAWGVSYVGATPVLVDVDPETYNMAPELIEKAITSRTKAIIAVHLYGQAACMDKIREIAQKHNLKLIEDVAQAHGASFKEKNTGTFGDVACYSFYPGKNLGAGGEAGALVTNQDEYASLSRLYRNHGQPQKYIHNKIGYNYRMEGVQGAVLGVKLNYLPEWTRARQERASWYNELLSGVGLVLPKVDKNSTHVYHLYVVQHPKRDALLEALHNKKIICGIHYPIPIHLQECYRHLRYRKGTFPVTEKISSQCLSLPLYPELSKEQVEYIASAIKAIL